jgi:cytochrome d ubiquinol oxidase subunit II
MTTSGPLAVQMRGYVKWLGVGTLGFIALVSLLTPFQDAVCFQRWFAFPGVVFSGPVPVIVAALTWVLFGGPATGRDASPFLASLGLFVVSFIGIGISFYPHIVPPGLTMKAAAAPDSSLAFALVGTVVLVPVILAYTACAYWVFRGKVDPSGGYH